MARVDWLADVLRGAGLTVVEYPNWKTRAAPGSFEPRGLILHHDASPMGLSPSIAHLIAEVGNATTPPPLSQCWVDFVGVWHVLAAGRCNHAGIGSGWGVIRANMGNTDAIGVETDHTVGEAWPAFQLQSVRRGCAVILKRIGASPLNAFCGHKEYAPGRKIDPDGLSMGIERTALMSLPPLPTIPSVRLESDDMPSGSLSAHVDSEEWAKVSLAPIPPVGQDTVKAAKLRMSCGWGQIVHYRVFCVSELGGYTNPPDNLPFEFTAHSDQPGFFWLPVGTAGVNIEYYTELPDRNVGWGIELRS